MHLPGISTASGKPQGAFSEAMFSGVSETISIETAVLPTLPNL